MIAVDIPSGALMLRTFAKRMGISESQLTGLCRASRVQGAFWSEKTKRWYIVPHPVLVTR